MLDWLRRRHRMRERLPVTLAYLPYWIRRTARASTRTAVERDRRWGDVPLATWIRPSLTRPVFVIGSPRSGTTFLGECLSRLPELSYFHEPVLTKGAVAQVYGNAWSHRRAARLYRTTYAWLMRHRREPHLRFCEKTPGNCFIVPFLAATFPDAQFIHIRRDGRDAALSLVAKRWYNREYAGRAVRDEDGYLYGPGPRFWLEPGKEKEYGRTDDFHRCLWLWRRHGEEADAGFAQVDPERVMTCRYEDLVTEPARHAQEILKFLGIDAPASREAFTRYVTDAASPASVGRWRTALDAEQRETARREAGGLLSSLGYEVY